VRGLLESVCEFKLAYEAEVGLEPSVDEMHDVVVVRRQRPQFDDNWTHNVVCHSLTHYHAASLLTAHRSNGASLE